MKKTQLIFLALILMLQSAQGATLTVPGIDDAELNNKLTTLAQSNASFSVQKTQMTNVVASLLTNLSPQIKAFSGYDNPFVINCTIFFNSQIDKVKCDLDFNPPEELLEHADPHAEILRANLQELPNSNILVIRASVDLSAGTYLFGRGKFYLRQPWIEDETTAPSKVFTATEETTETLSVTSSTPLDATASCSETDSPSVTPDTASQTESETSSVISTPSMSVEISQTPTFDFKPPTANWSAASGIYEDATNQPGRYEINDDVVTDTFSNFQWEQAHSNTTYNWTYANNTYCQSRTTGGYTDWRLPAVLELQSLVDYTIHWKGSDPGINSTVFPNTPLAYFWSATPMAGGTPAQSWYVSYGRNSCYSGSVYSSKWECGHVSSTYIRCTRAGQASVITNRYDTTTPEVVKDKKTALIWEKRASTNTMPWNGALTHCNGRTTGNKTGWRLPTVKELSTLLDHSVAPGGLIMDNVAFAGEPNIWSWSSSPVSGDAGHAWSVHFYDGGVYGRSVYNGYRVRCVCDSNCRPIPIANWNASTGIYEDATNQTDRYKVEDGVVTDTFSNLQWERAASNDTMSWLNATDYCANRNTGDHQGWRLPAVQELQSLVDYTIDWKGNISGINGTAFPKTPLNYFWSSVPVAGYSGQAWYVSYGKDACNSGLVCNQINSQCPCVSSNVGYVRCVYGNIIPPATNNRYDITSIPNVVKDLVTGLMWERQASSSTSSTILWQPAITYCATQTTSGFSGWRLPTVKELSTLLNYIITPNNLIMNQEIFAGEPVTWYWSATPVSGAPGYALRVDFHWGSIIVDAMSYNFRVRCVLGPCSGAITQADTAVSPHASLGSKAVLALCWELSRKDSTGMVWSVANNHCTQKGGGWRLPNIYELYALWQQKTVLGSDLYTNLFWWSSTPYSGNTLNGAWYVNFFDGGVSGHNMSSRLNLVRCCRDL